MKHELKILACAAACLSTVSLAQPALAKNRAYPATAAVFEDPNSVPCFSHAAGNPVLKNTCSTSKNVFLPMSVDGADWYTASVYGKGWISANGGHNTIWCTSNGLPHDASTLYGYGWHELPNNSSFGGAQTLTMPAVPVYSPGDALYAYCQLAPNTQLFTYGWN